MAVQDFIPPNELTEPELSQIAQAANYMPLGGYYGVDILFGLGAHRSGGGRDRTKHVYGGTVPAATVHKRRAANRVARKSRRANRLRGA